MKKSLVFPLIATLSFVGGGCNLSQPSQPSPAPEASQPTPSKPADNTPPEPGTKPAPVGVFDKAIWKTYADNNLGFQMKYPVLDETKTWSPAAGELDLSAFPKQGYITRKMTVEAKKVPAGIACPPEDQYTNPLGTLFCTSVTREGAAGSTYETHSYRTIINGAIVSVNVVVKYLNDNKIVGDCAEKDEKDPSWEETCRPFDAKKDLAIIDEVIKTIGPNAISDTVSFTTAKIQKKKPAVYEVDVSFPQIDKGDATIATAFNAAVRNPLDKEVADLIKDALEAEKENVIGPGMWSITMDAMATYQSPRLINSFLSGSVYTGGAHPNLIYQNVILDRTTKKALHVKDLFVSADKGLAYLSEASRKALKQKSQAMEMSDEDWLKTGTEPDDANFSQTHLTEQGLTITFPPYQVAAYAAGPQEVQIPWKDIQSLIKPEYLPAVK